MNSAKPLLALAFTAACLVLSGCFSSNPADIQAWTKPHEIDVTLDRYVLMPPDEIQILCSKVPELHEQQQQIRPDGKVSFETIGEFDVAGKTCSEVADLMRERVTRLYALTGHYPIDVRVVRYASQYYYVEGQVNRPGPRPITGRDTLSHALSLAQPNVLAWVERIQVVRPSIDPNVPPKIFEVNLDQMWAHGKMDTNVLLEPGDIVFVPPTVLSGAAMVVEEVVRPIGRAFATVNIVQGPQD